MLAGGLDAAHFFALPSVAAAVRRGCGGDAPEPSEAPSPLAPFSGAGWYVVGGEHTGKTTMLMQLGLNAAAAGHRVVLWCDRAKLMQQPPIPEVEMASADEGTLQRLEMRPYAPAGGGPTGAEALLRWLTGLHVQGLASCPSVVLADDLGLWSEDATQAGRVLSLLQATVEWLRGAEASGALGARLAGACYAVTDSPHHGMAREPLRRWAPLRADITRCGGDPPPAGLRAAPSAAQGQPPAVLMRARFATDPPALADAMRQRVTQADVYYWLTRQRLSVAAAAVRRPGAAAGQRAAEPDAKRPRSSPQR
eukprot:TRINITY_DN8379_c0_g1_i1.p1 TRINITY_DN8379_c0_g1~~TRINITY_DN8379_c0_g1_i1.p1  ORF type:complete len:361 (+),score=115.66 TRINITY_DN8379_c0_g1_i1:157-1083(+)